MWVSALSHDRCAVDQTRNSLATVLTRTVHVTFCGANGIEVSSTTACVFVTPSLL